jgi:glycosyltransferase involved in cell wall biosynthesis
VKKGLLIYRINKDDVGNSGVIKKCHGQLDGFKKLGLDVDIFWLSNKGILKNEELVHLQNLKPKSLSLYWFYLTAFGWHLLKYNDFKAYDFIYLRHPFFDPILVKCLKKAKAINPDLKIILEINTFPYDAEPKRFLHKISLWLDKMYRKEASNFIDRIVHYGAESSIWNIPAICIRNGVQIKAIPISKRKSEENSLRLLAVGNWSYWHGIDRIIRGLANYNKEEREVKVSLKIIGNGTEEIQIEQMIKENQLENVVEIESAKYGEELDVFFNKADMGVGTLAIHRKGVSLDSSLKHREYCARGIPFLIAGEDPDFGPEEKFVFTISSNDDPVNLEKVVEYYFRNKLSDRLADIRVFAEINLGWSTKLKPVVDWIQSI